MTLAGIQRRIGVHIEPSPISRGPRMWTQDPTPKAKLGSITDFRTLASRFEPIHLAEMDEVALLNRTDTKYVMSRYQLYLALTALRRSYRVLEVNGTRLSRYKTVYFDTEDLALYHDHHSGKRIRYKVRSRQYAESGLSFLEVKSNGKRGRTDKKRIRTESFVSEWPAALAAIEGSLIQIDSRVMEAKVANEFYRITLVGKRLRERVTLDLGLEFSAAGKHRGLPNIAIAEVKQDGANRDSEFVRQMRMIGVRPNGFSKYCMGVSMLYDNVKHNRFKPNLLLIEDLARSSYDA